MILDKSRRHLHRYREIARVLAKHGWGWMVSRLGFPEHLRRHAALTPEEHAPAHVREMLEELGPTFIKLGQLLSTRSDLIPEPYISELAKLQDTAPTVPVPQIKAIIESEFCNSINELFLAFDEVPLAAASLAQVHCAKLLDGTPVIVKVQRPNIRDLVETDIEILYKRARFLDAHWERARTYGILDIVDEFAITIREELDYTREARNTDRLREQLAGEKGIRIPQVYWNLTSHKVLTLERIIGTKITDMVDRPLPGLDLSELADRLASVFLKQVFVDGFFHADPHPGNILVTPEGDIGLVDCGQVGRLDVENRAGAIRMLMAFEQHDPRVLADEVLHLGIAQGEVDVRLLTRDLSRVIRTYYDVPSSSVNMGQLLTRVLNVSANHRIRLPVSFAVLGKVFTSIDGICSQLDPNFNFTAIARNYVGKAVRSELSSETMVNDFYRALVSGRNFLFALPEQLERLMRKAVEGAVRIEFKHLGIEELESTFERGANRIAIGLIVAAAIVGSSVIVSAGRGAHYWFGLPALGIFGYIVATVFGGWLITAILRSGGRRR